MRSMGQTDQQLNQHTMTHETQETSSLPLELPEYETYGRQMLVPQIGLAGQVKLKKSKVLVVGAGGLGSPALAYLAGAGVGMES